MSLLFTILRAPFRFVYWHPWWSIFLATVGFFVSTVGAYKFVEYRSYCDLAAAIAETDAASPRWRIEELEADRAVIPDADNSAIVIARVEALRKLAEQQIPPQFDLDSFEWPTDYPAIQHRLPAAKLDQLRGALRGIQPALDEAAKLTTMPRGRWPIKHEPDGISTMLPHIATVRGVARLLYHQACVASHDANSSLTTDCVIGMFHVGASLADEPTAVSRLVRNSIWAMTQGAMQSALALSSLRDDDLVRLEQIVVGELAAFDGSTAIRGERALLHAFFTHLEQSDSISYLAAVSSVRNVRTGIGLVTDPLYRPLIPADHAFALRMMNRGCAIAVEPFENQSAGFAEWERDLAQSVWRGPYVYRNLVAGDLLPSSAALHSYQLRAVAQLRTMRAALAAERFRLVHQRWPEQVAELVPTFIDKPLLDPFDGQPLRMTTDEKGVTIYSIGENRQDDDGAVFSSFKEGDVGMKLFNPDQRGMPALPEKQDEASSTSESNNP